MSLEDLARQISAVSGGYQPMAEYSTSKGFLPMDIGTANSNRNMLAGMVGGGDMLPLLLALLNGTYDSSMFAPDTSEQDAGYNELNAIVASSGPQSVEGLLATEILNGASPSEAVEGLEFYMTDQGLLDDVTDLDKWRDNVAKVAGGYFDKKISSDVAVPKETDGSRLAKLMGLPADLNAEFTPDLLNPELAAMRQRAEDDKSALRDSRAADQLKYTKPQQDAMQDYLSGGLSETQQGGNIRSARSTRPVANAGTAAAASARQSMSQPTQGGTEDQYYMGSDGKLYLRDAPLSEQQKAMVNFGTEIDAEDPYFQGWGSSPDLVNPWNERQSTASGAVGRREDEERRGNMAQIPAGQFLSSVGPMQTNRWSGESVSAQNKALSSGFLARQEQADADALAAALKKRGINPTQIAMQAFLGGGQRALSA